ncbi:MAG: hypothetical protein ABH825_02995 [Candidatus Omnitrophota bacterium]
MEIPALPEDTVLFESEEAFGYRGKVGSFVISPCKAGAFYDKKIYYSGGDDRQSVKIMYSKNDKKAFCGAYTIIMGNISGFKTMSFWVKGKEGGETFEIGMNDAVSNKREDAVFIGAVNRYLPKGITTKWQKVNVLLEDFYGPDISKAYSLVLHFNQLSEGTIWIDEIEFLKDDLVSPVCRKTIDRTGYLLLDDFNYSDLNLLGRKTNTYKKLPSLCVTGRVSEERVGESGRSLKITYRKEAAGWAGYYTLLNQIDGEYYDLTPYGAASFMVKGEKGGETFEIGMADKNWLTIGDSLKAGPVDKYLPGGVTTQWREVVIPLKSFGLLNFKEMGSFVINFNEKQTSSVYIDDLKFYLKKEGEGQ